MSALLTRLESFDPFLSLLRDLSHVLPARERYARLLATVRRLFDCDACALLRLEGEALVPVAVDGLRHDALGRRFRVADHPRLEVLMACVQPFFFSSDSPLPDPYDGLVSGESSAILVHDCIGCPLQVGGQAWGLLTLDAMRVGQLARIDPREMQMLTSIAAATVSAAQRTARATCELHAPPSHVEAGRPVASVPAPPVLVGQSRAFLEMLAELRVVAASDLTVLIQGETGTGKELVARAVHAASARSAQPLITINCAALPETLIESELFGHVRGAFSGATSDRRGKFELAHGGTLFLDEIGELSLAVQAKLLRAMQSGQIQRVGSERDHLVDVRIIAASNRDLAQELRQGRCRADFYHRLCVYLLQVPPLRERGQDVLEIAGYFLERQRARLGLRGLSLTPDAERALLHHDWPGNVRELEHLLARSALKTSATHRDKSSVLRLDAAALGLTPPEGTHEVASATPALKANAGHSQSLRDAVDSFERQLIEEGLRRNTGNWSATARELQMDRANLNRTARRLGLRPKTSGLRGKTSA